MQKWKNFGLQSFLSSHPMMVLIECSDRLIIQGEYRLKAKMEGFHEIEETYHLKIMFPENFPREIPVVIEENGDFPRNPDYHTYDDGSFCLGSDIKLKFSLSKAPDISGFITNILDPFLYSIAYKIKYNVFPNGELKHGEIGLINDYEEMFKVTGKKAVLGVLRALGKRKRDANKLHCPCGCGYRLGKCNYRFELNQWRGLEKRRWFRNYLSKSFTPIEKPKKKRKYIQ